MRTVNDVLREADPVRHEAAVGLNERDRIRRAVVAAAGHPPRAGTPPWLPSVVAILAVALVVGIVAPRMHFGGNATLEAAVRFEVRLAQTQPAEGLQEARIAGSADVLYLHQEPIVTNADIAQARAIALPDGRFDVAVTFNAAGAEKMRKATSGHLGQPLAILIDGDLVAAPTVRSPIDAEARITGGFTKAEAERLATGMIGR